MYFFFLCMKAPGCSPDNPRRCNDTRYSLSRRLRASTLAAFVAEPLGGTTGRALKKKRKKALAAALEGIRVKLILIQQYKHICVVFFLLQVEQTEEQQPGFESRLDCSCLKMFFKKICKQKKKASGKHQSSLKCPPLMLLWSGKEAKAAVFPFASPSFVHICFRCIPVALGVIGCTQSSTCEAFLNTRIWRAALQLDVWEHSLKCSLTFFSHKTLFSPHFCKKY